MNERSPSRTHEPLGLNRTFLFLLVVGLTVAAWQRNKGGPTPNPNGPPPLESKPATLSPTNSNAERSLAAAGRSAQK